MLEPGVTPRSLGRPREIAGRLHDIYPGRALAHCLDVTARLYCHADWAGLEGAVQKGERGAPLLEDLPEELAIDRRHHHQRIICTELAGIPYRPYPGVRAPVPSERYHHFLTYEALSELKPTASEIPAPPQYVDIDIQPARVLPKLPRALSSWWAKTIPGGEMAAKALNAMVIDPDNRISMLKACWTWTTLCLQYGDRVPESMVRGVAFLFAGRYSAVSVQDSWAFEEVIERAKRMSSERERDLFFHRATNDLYAEAAHLFLDGMAIEYLAGAYRADGAGFIDHARQCIVNILSASP